MMPQSLLAGAPRAPKDPVIITEPAPEDYPIQIGNTTIVIPEVYSTYGNMTTVSINNLPLMGGSNPRADQIVLMWAASDEVTYGVGGSGFELYFFADGTVKVWNRLGVEFPSQFIYPNVPPNGVIPDYTLYPRVGAKIATAANPYIGGATGDQIGVNLWAEYPDGSPVLGLWSTNMWAPFGQTDYYEICKFPFNLYTGAMPANNSGWVGVPGAALMSAVTVPTV